MLMPNTVSHNRRIYSLASLTDFDSEQLDLFVHGIKRVTPKETKLLDLFLQGAENREIARELNIKVRTVKAMFQTLYVKYRIYDGGVKRVKLAVLVYRERSKNDLKSKDIPNTQ